MSMNHKPGAPLTRKHASNESPSESADTGCLTAREREVLALIAQGNSSKQIAHLLSISLSTVVTHRYRLQQKSQLHTTADLVRAAIRMGLVEP
jgi:DNA-binding CsgD family transcriptional regulator